MDSGHALRSTLVVFWFPGMGLGKITRAMAIARHLNVQHLIYAASYVEFGREKGFNVRRCCKGAIEDFASMGPKVIVTDTHPYEKSRMLANVNAKHVFIARKCLGKKVFAAGFDAVVDPHERYVMIRQPEEWLDCEKAQEIIGEDYPVLGFHAGMWAEERPYIKKIAEKKAKELGKRLVWFEPEAYWPVCELFPAAGHIVCAAGYNAFAETQAWGGPVTYVTLGRNFDDQAERLNEVPYCFNGARFVAEMIDAYCES